jgi:hypothetical protein
LPFGLSLGFSLLVAVFDSVLSRTLVSFLFDWRQADVRQLLGRLGFQRIRIALFFFGRLDSRLFLLGRRWRRATCCCCGGGGGGGVPPLGLPPPEIFSSVVIIGMKVSSGESSGVLFGAKNAEPNNKTHSSDSEKLPRR